MKLAIPDPALVLLVGPSGAGKSTFAAANFRPTEIVSADTARALIADDPGDQNASAEAFHIVSLIINGRLRRRLMTVVDATNLRAPNRKRYTRIAARYGVPSVAIAFDLAVAEYQRRNAARPGRVVDAFVVDDQVARMADVLVDLRDEGHATLFVVNDREPVEVTRFKGMST